MYFRSIQILRVVAALLVVAAHLNAHSKSILGGIPLGFYHTVANFFPSRSVVFLVVSGFVMAYLLDRGGRNFLKRRLLRIFPLYLIVLVLAVIAKLHFLQYVFTWNTVWRASLLPLGPPVDVPGYLKEYPLGVEWTLVYQVFFYVVCGFFAREHAKRYFVPVMVAWLGVILTAAWLWPVPAGEDLFPAGVHILVAPFNILFISGALTYRAFKALPPATWSHTAGYVAGGLAMLALAEFCGRSQVLWPRTAAKLGCHYLYPTLVLFGIGLGLLILAVTTRDRGAARPAKLSLLERLADYSYALFLVHVPIFEIIFLVSLQHPGYAPWTLALAAVGASFVAAWVVGSLDLKLNGLVRRKLSGRPANAGPPPRAGIRLPQAVAAQPAPVPVSR